jgi:protein-tyrosine kinase
MSTPPPNSTLSAKAQSAGRSIGAILVDTGRLSAVDAEKILRLQSTEGLKFGEAAIRLGLASENDILYALSVQFNHPFLSTPLRPGLSDKLVAAYRPFSKEGEQVRMLRSQLQLRWFDENRKHTALAMVSPGKGEGRSFLAANLAIAFSQAGERTLLIDGDMRDPCQHKLFNLENNNGLSRLLAGRIDDRVVNFVPGLPGLGVLTAGPIPPNAMELLGRHGFDAILAKSMASFDVVIIDTPAANVGPDAELLSRFAGAAIAIARTNLTRMNDFNQMVESLRQNGTQVVGSVLVDALPTPTSANEHGRN